MKTRNGGHSVEERRLFHSTDSKYIDAICGSNFDWRICGTHGTAYGKGELTATGRVDTRIRNGLNLFG